MLCTSNLVFFALMNYSFITFLAGDKYRTHVDVVSNSHVVVLRVCSESRGRDVYRDVAGGCDVADPI
jgi:hypothetical protein